PLAREVHALVRPHFLSTYDETQAIGRRYRRQDEIGTPLCVTIDFPSLDDHAVTIRERDSMAQVRVPIAELVDRLQERLSVSVAAKSDGVLEIRTLDLPAPGDLGEEFERVVADVMSTVLASGVTRYPATHASRA